MSGLLCLFIFRDIKLRDLDINAQKFGGKKKLQNYPWFA
jgi:hypothetical protein